VPGGSGYQGPIFPVPIPVSIAVRCPWRSALYSARFACRLGRVVHQSLDMKEFEKLSCSHLTLVSAISTYVDLATKRREQTFAGVVL